MERALGIALPIALWIAAYLLARRETNAYAERGSGDTDVFVYSKRRYVRRMLGVGILVCTGMTLMAWELVGASTAGGAMIYMGLLGVEVAALVVLPVLDLRETTRTAAPEDLTRQAGRGRRKRSR